MLPRQHDRVTTSDYPGLELKVIACFGSTCGVTSDLWPKGATHTIDVGTIQTINDLMVSAPNHEVSKRNKRNGRSKAA